MTKRNFYSLVNISKDRIGKDDYYNLNSNKIRKELNWRVKVDIDDGLKRTLKWIDNNFAKLKREKLNYIHKK